MKKEPKVKLVAPFHDRVAIRCEEAAGKSAGGILLPDRAKEKPRTGVVEAVGPGKRDANGDLHPPAARVGDTVLFMRYEAAHVDPDDDTLLLVKDENVFARVEV